MRLALSCGPRRHTRRTEQAYVDWVGRFLLFHGKWHHREFAEKEVVESLSDLAVNRKVSAKLSAFIFVPTIS
jgi:hypothetical protein